MNNNTTIHYLEPKWRPFHDLVYSMEYGQCITYVPTVYHWL